MLHFQASTQALATRHSAKGSSFVAPRVSGARFPISFFKPTLLAKPVTGRRVELVCRALAEQEYNTEAGYGDQSAAEAESCQVFVANLPFQVTSDDLGEHFSRVPGYVRAMVMMRNGRSRGIGLVEFDTPAAAQQAVEELNETDFNGRTLLARISVPAPRRERGEYEQEGFGASGDRPQRRQQREREPRRETEPGSVLYVSNLSYQTSWMELKDHFAAVGSVQFANVLKNADGRSRGCGMVTFSNAGEADSAMEQLHESELGGRRLNVRKFVPREEMGA